MLIQGGSGQDLVPEKFILEEQHRREINLRNPFKQFGDVRYIFSPGDYHFWMLCLAFKNEKNNDQCSPT